MSQFREILRVALPESLANRYRDFRDKVQTAKNHYVLQRELDDRLAWRGAASALRILLQPMQTVLFFPERPIAPYAAYTLCTWLGYTIVKDPKRRFDVAFKRKNRTFFDPAVLDAVPVRREKIINAGSVDISKRTVGRGFAEVFGYSVDVDPLLYDGEMVEKSDINATHDGRIVQGPLTSEQVKQDAVYQRLIDNQSDRSGFFVDYRTPVYGGRIPFIYLKFRHRDDRFDNYVDAAMKEVEEIFSPEDLEKILLFCRRMGVDYCELDVLKDADDRIYIVDVGNTPGAAVRLLPKGERRTGLERMAKSFGRLLKTHGTRL